MDDQSKTLLEKIEPLRQFVDGIGTLDVDRGELFSACLYASFVKAFEYVELSTRQELDSTFFLVPSLRSIVEDIIVLRTLSGIPPQSREKYLKNSLELQVEYGLKDQFAFYKYFRPYQDVLPPRGKAIDIDCRKDELISFWQANGWPNFNHRGNRPPISPPIKQLAEKVDPAFLNVVYEFIYRLASGSVHFNPQALLSLGWGKIAPTGGSLPETTFSTTNMSIYYRAIIQIYGGYLFCLYFELFDEFIVPNTEEQAAVVELRRHISDIYSWPEMVTYKEFNMPGPNGPHAFDVAVHLYCVDTIAREGFVSGGKELMSMFDQSESG